MSNSINPQEPLLVVISGPSGVGKDTVIQRMKERHLPFHFIITATTRAPRADEQQGVDYIFITHEEFAQMLKRDELLEHARVYEDYKGIPKAQVHAALSSGKDAVLRVDVQGAATIRKLCPEALLIFLKTQDEQEMIARLKRRKSETPEGLKLRIATAKQELKRISEFDYVVINHENQLDETVDTIVDIIRSEHARSPQRKVWL